MLLQQFTERAIQAHNWTSFNPERRGNSLIAEFSKQLSEDLEKINVLGAKYGYGTEYMTGTRQSYQEKYERHFSAWLSAKGNCISSMITGPARFPTRKAEKANNAEHSKYQFFQDWRERCLKAIERGLKPKETPVTELEKAQKDLAGCLKAQEIMKAANVIIRKAKGADCTEALIALGLKEGNARAIQTPDFINRIGYPAYKLSNNLANIKRLEIRVAELEAKATKHTNKEEDEITINGVRILQNYEADRVQIIFEGKPAEEVRNKLKKRAFKWSPRYSAWQRKLTREALICAKEIVSSL
jgi:hypothetical protein